MLPGTIQAIQTYHRGFSVLQKRLENDNQRRKIDSFTVCPELERESLYLPRVSALVPQDKHRVFFTFMRRQTCTKSLLPGSEFLCSPRASAVPLPAGKLQGLTSLPASPDQHMWNPSTPHFTKHSRQQAQPKVPVPHLPHPGHSHLSY